MKKVKNYIDADLAKKKIARYRYWTIKDENGITIVSSDDNPNNQTFEDVLDKIIADNVDAEVQVRFGTNDQSSRQNTPLFIRINESIEWIEPEDDDDTIKVNGVPHKVDKNGNVNINLNTPEPQILKAEPQQKIENGNIDFFRQEMEMQLQGLRREHELKEEKMQVDLQNRLFEQTLKFKEMMLSDRENRINEREQTLAQKESHLDEKEKELQGNVKGYMKQIVPALGGLAKEFFTDKDKGLSGTDKETKKEKPPRPRRKVNFSINEDEVEITDEELENEIAQYEDQEPEIIEEEETEIESNTNTQNENENETDLSVHESHKNQTSYE